MFYRMQIPKPESDGSTIPNTEQHIMIYDTVENLGSYAAIAPEIWSKAVEFINACLAKAPAAGRVEIDGDKLYASVQYYNPKTPNLEKFEAHRDYVDIQLLLAGSETIYYAPSAGLPVVTPFTPGKDCAMYRVNSLGEATPLAMKPGNWALFLPGEAHLPGVGDPASSAIKVVLKIAASTLKR